MWNSRKSIILSLVATIILAAIFSVLIFTAPAFFKWCYSFLDNNIKYYSVLVKTFYACCIPAACTLAAIIKLLINLKRDEVFIWQNVWLLRALSWCCFSVVPITFAAGFYFFSLYFISVAAAFVALILRVLKNIMAAATQIKQENELTI
jgi:hypothetical protein